MKLELKNLSKSYKEKEVLRDISCELTTGVYGLLGPNGAGKTTLMKIICRLLEPYNGQIFWNGQKQDKHFCNELGFLPQDFSYYPTFSGFDFLLYMATLKGMGKSQGQKEARHLLELVGLSDVSKKKISSYSGGMKQRLGIAQALLNNPKILVLDEPTVGLDPKERIRFRNLISELSSERIIMLFTHIVSDLEAIAKEILILKDKTIDIKGSASQLLSIIEGKCWEILISERDRGRYQAAYTIVNERIVPEGLLLRVVGNDAPKDGARPVIPNLEDLYLYCFKEEVGL